MDNNPTEHIDTTHNSALAISVGTESVIMAPILIRKLASNNSNKFLTYFEFFVD